MTVLTRISTSETVRNCSKMYKLEDFEVQSQIETINRRPKRRLGEKEFHYLLLIHSCTCSFCIFYAIFRTFKIWYYFFIAIFSMQNCQFHMFVWYILVDFSSRVFATNLHAIFLIHSVVYNLKCLHLQSFSNWQKKLRNFYFFFNLIFFIKFIKQFLTL